MISIFVKKKNVFLFYLVRYTNYYAKTKKILRNFDYTILAKCMEFVRLVFFHKFSLWNCMIGIFGLWRSTWLCSTSGIDKICSFEL